MSKLAIVLRTALRLAHLHPTSLGIVDEVVHHMRLLARGVAKDGLCTLTVYASGEVEFSLERADSLQLMYQAQTSEGRASLGTILTRDATPEPKKES